MKTPYLAIAAAFSIAGCERPVSVNDSPEATFQAWEYKQTTSFSKDFPGEDLDKLGADGWELVDVHRERDRGYFTLYTFKRPKGVAR